MSISEQWTIKIVIPVKTGIQDAEEEYWIPACAGMTAKEGESVRSNWSRPFSDLLAFKVRVVQLGSGGYHGRV